MELGLRRSVGTKLVEVGLWRSVGTGLVEVGASI